MNRLTCLDPNLAMAFLLEVKDSHVENFANAFKFHSSTSYEFLLYLFSLNLMGELCKHDKFLYTNFNSKFYYYFVRSSTLIQFVEALDTDQLASTNSYKQFKRVNKLYTEFNQKNMLDELKLGIDLKRFETDPVYKRETILDLSIDLHTFQLACSLARFYEQDVWKVYMTFTEYFLIEHESAGVLLDGVEKKINPLLPVLKSRMSEFAANMETNVLSLIDGKDLAKQVVYYTILGTDTSMLHVKILTKLQSLSLESLDYKRLLENPLDTIEAYLDDSNIKLFEKLLTKLPVKNESLG